MEIVSRYHISGSNTFAIVEGQSLSELKDPSGRAVGRFEALGKVWLNEIFLIDLSQTGPEESLAEDQPTPSAPIEWPRNHGGSATTADVPIELCRISPPEPPNREYVSGVT
jgi:hypothetical protein